MDHRTVIGQDVTYSDNPSLPSDRYLIYVEHDGLDVLVTSNDGWYGLRTFTADTEAAAAELFRQIIDAPKASLQRLYGEACDWFQALPAAKRVADAPPDPVLPSDDDVRVVVIPTR